MVWVSGCVPPKDHQINLRHCDVINASVKQEMKSSATEVCFRFVSFLFSFLGNAGNSGQCFVIQLKTIREVQCLFGGAANTSSNIFTGGHKLNHMFNLLTTCRIF